MVEQKKPDHLQESVEERYKKLQDDHVKRQAKTVTPHDLRMAERKKNG